MDNTNQPTPADRNRSTPSSLFRSLMRKLGRSRTGAAALPPAGQRSGRGSDSLEPYLSEARRTRPGALE
ncbi:MAG: hypothetical protein ACXWC6_10515 [Ramlibacter sp.]